MKVGDLVRYTVPKNVEDQPVGVIVKLCKAESHYHQRIKVMWAGNSLPIQASALSVKGGRITSWVSPKNFSVVSGIN